jgi:hypothetical protein
MGSQTQDIRGFCGNGRIILPDHDSVEQICRDGSSPTLPGSCVPGNVTCGMRLFQDL